MSKSKSSQRFRNACTIVYPDSAPSNWVDILRDLHVNVFISPLHDKDVNPDDNEPKKPHFHVLLMYDNVHSREQFSEVFDSINGVGLEVVSSLRGVARYLCHLDNPEKYQYSPSDVISLGCVDYNSIIGLPTDKYKVCSEMLSWCKENGVMYFSDLVEYSSIYRDDWFRALADNCTVFMSAYFRSLHARQKDAGRSDI